MKVGDVFGFSAMMSRAFLGPAVDAKCRREIASGGIVATSSISKGSEHFVMPIFI